MSVLGVRRGIGKDPEPLLDPSAVLRRNDDVAHRRSLNEDKCRQRILPVLWKTKSTFSTRTLDAHRTRAHRIHRHHRLRKRGQNLRGYFTLSPPLIAVS